MVLATRCSGWYLAGCHKHLSVACCRNPRDIQPAKPPCTGATSTSHPFCPVETRFQPDAGTGPTNDSSTAGTGKRYCLKSRQGSVPRRQENITSRAPVHACVRSCVPCSNQSPSMMNEEKTEQPLDTGVRRFTPYVSLRGRRPFSPRKVHTTPRRDRIWHPNYRIFMAGGGPAARVAEDEGTSGRASRRAACSARGEGEASGEKTARSDR